MSVGARRSRLAHVRVAGCLVLIACAARADVPRSEIDRTSGFEAALQPKPRAGARAPAATQASGSSALGEASRAALARGLAWLAARQASSEDGSFPTGSAREPAPVAICALGALAFMAGGSSPERGPQGRELAALIDWLLGHTELDPQARHPGYITKKGDALSRMHGHGFATLTLAQAWSMSPKSARGARIERALRAAIECIEKSQGVEGGWWYEPEKGLSHEGSITICLVQALRAAHNAGLKVDPLAISRALDYVARSQKPNGSFRYALGDDYATLALSAAAIATLQAGGEYEGRTIEDGYLYLFRGLAARESRGAFDGELGLPISPVAPGGEAGEFPEGDQRHPYCYFYERLYVAQALWQNAEARTFDEWAARERARVLTSQRPDGSWRDPRYGDEYATSVNCLFLALPEGLLPIFQR